MGAAPRHVSVCFTRPGWHLRVCEMTKNALTSIRLLLSLSIVVRDKRMLKFPDMNTNSECERTFLLENRSNVPIRCHTRIDNDVGVDAPPPFFFKETRARIEWSNIFGYKKRTVQVDGNKFSNVTECFISGNLTTYSEPFFVAKPRKNLFDTPSF